MKLKQTILALVISFGISFLSVGYLASAAPIIDDDSGSSGYTDTGTGDPSGSGGDVNECGTNILPCTSRTGGDAATNSPIWNILLMAINILTAGVGIAAVGGIIYGSILYTSAADDAGQVKKAKEIIVNVVIGIIAYFLMFSFLNFIIPGGFLTTS